MEAELSDGDSGVETLIVNDFTEGDIKSAVEDYLDSKEFIYNEIGEGDFTGCVYFTVKVELVPMSDARETLYAGVYFDHIVDWDETWKSL